MSFLGLATGPSCRTSEVRLPLSPFSSQFISGHHLVLVSALTRYEGDHFFGGSMIMVLSTLRMPILGASALVTFLLLFPVLGLAQSSELESLRATVKGMEQQMQKT